jgi:hypothetical protein
MHINVLSAAGWTQLVGSLSAAVANRDIQINLSDPHEQALIHQIGADGIVNRTTADYLFVVDTNLSYNKINPFVHTEQRYQVRVRADRWLDATLTLRITDGPVPQYIATQSFGPGGVRLAGS